MNLAARALARDRLAREHRLVYLQRVALVEDTISRNLIACLYYHRVANNDITAGYELHTALTHHLHLLLLIKLGEDIKLPRGVHLEDEPYGSGEEYGEDYADGLDILVLDNGEDKRDGRGH